MSVEPLSPNEKASLPRFSKPTSLSSSPSSKNSSAVQSPVNAAKYKTQICKSFDQTGTCPYNSKCLFAHGAKELRTPTPSSSTRRQSVNAIVVSLHAAGRLSSTASSPTAAGPDTKIIATAPRQWSASVSSKEGAPSPKSASNAGEKAIVLYKTELCRSFASTGSCPYGNKCQFAHGDTELRTVQRHKNYKTTKCEKFHSAGHCPFGLRCIFIHDEDERELPNSESFDPEFASAARQRRASQQYEKLQVEQESKELDGEFLKRRFSETEAKDAE